MPRSTCDHVECKFAVNVLLCGLKSSVRNKKDEEERIREDAYVTRIKLVI